METRTNHPIVDFDAIVNELSYRVGRPDLTKEEHLQVLINILKEAKWPNSAITYFIRNIIIIAEANKIEPQQNDQVKIYLQKGEKPPENKKIYRGPKGGYYFIGTKHEKSKNDNLTNKSQQNKEPDSKENNTVTVNPEQPEQPEQSNQPKPNVKEKSIEPKVQFDEEGKYVPSEKDKQIVRKASKDAATKGAMLIGNDKNLMADFENDIETLINTRDPKLAFDIVKKYDLKINQDVKVTEPSKLYIGAIDKQYRKIFSGDGNRASSIVAQILKDAGALANKGGWIKKSMVANKIFTKTKKLKVSKDKNGNIKLGNHSIDKINERYKDIEKQLLNRGIDKNKAKEIADYINRWSKQYDATIDKINIILGGNELEVLDICDTCDVSTPEGRENAKVVTINKIIERMKTLSGNNITPGIKKIIDEFNSLFSIKDKEKYEDKLNDILYQFSMDKDTTVTSADIAEIIDYLRILNNDIPVYLPSASNFELGDLLTLPGKTPDINDIMKNINNLSSIFISLDDRSVKKGIGGASAIGPKFKLSLYKNENIAKDLKKIYDNYDELFNRGDIESSNKLIEELSKTYSYILKNDATYNKKMKNIDEWFKTNASCFGKEAYRKYYQLGYMAQAIYNSEVDIQLFKNSKYNVTKRGVTHEMSDGLNILAYLEFDPSQKTPDCRPNNKFPSRFHHHPRKN